LEGNIVNPAVSLTGIIASVAIGAAILAAGSTESFSVYNLPLFALCGAIGFILHWAIFIPSYLFKTEHYFDLTGSISFITTVIVALFLSPQLDVRDIVIGAMVVIWALRLGSFLFWRVKKQGKDNRFNVMKTQFLWFLMTWTLGGLWVLVTFAAGLAAITSATDKPLGLVGFIGIGLWLFGMFVEVLADHQKTQFRANADNVDKFVNTGLWAWSRHPNYFGEIVLWLGVSLVALPVLSGWQLTTMISPIFVYVLLTKVSGITLLERRGMSKWGSDPAYKGYLESTPILMLRPPRSS
jgi:steroid 5-alpha reductase family enzyme